MKKVECIRLQRSGLEIIVKGIKSKREREYIIEKIHRASDTYRIFYKLRKAIGV